MRHDCDEFVNGQVCGKLAVESAWAHKILYNRTCSFKEDRECERYGCRRIYFCAEHWDQFCRHLPDFSR